MYWVLTILLIKGKVTYGYKFLEKKNCEKVGKELTTGLKAKYICKRV